MTAFWSIFVGLVAGWIGGKLSGSTDSIFWGNVTVGVIGSLIGGFLFSRLGWGGYGALGTVLASALGAVVFLWILKLVAHSKTHS